MREGWRCPVCGRGVSPDEKVCDHGGGVTDVRSPHHHYPRLYDPWWIADPNMTPYRVTLAGYTPAAHTDNTSGQ